MCLVCHKNFNYSQFPSKVREKLNIWQTHFGSVFETSYSKISIERWLLNLSLKLSLCLDTFPPPGCLILTHIDISLFFWHGPDNISLLTFEVLEVLHRVKIILFLVDCSLLHGLTVSARDTAQMTDNIRIFLPM